MIFKTDNKLLDINENVTVYTDHGEPITLFISGYVIPTPDKYRFEVDVLQMNRKHINFSKLLDTEIKKDSVIIKNNSDQTIYVSYKESFSHLDFKVIPEKLEANKIGKVIITYDAAKRNSYGIFVDKVHLVIKKKDKTIDENVMIRAEIIEDFSNLTKEELANAPHIIFQKEAIHLGTLNPGTEYPVEFNFKNNGKNDLLIRNIFYTKGCELQSYDKIIKPGENGKIKFTIKPIKASDDFQKVFSVISNDPNNNTKKLKVLGVVVE